MGERETGSRWGCIVLLALFAGVCAWALNGVAHDVASRHTICRLPSGEIVSGRNKLELRDRDGFAVKYEYAFRCKMVRTK